jgi:hypothetical protein
MQILWLVVKKNLPWIIDKPSLAIIEIYILDVLNLRLQCLNLFLSG